MSKRKVDTKPDKFARMAIRLCPTGSGKADRGMTHTQWEVAKALRRVDRAAEKRGYEICKTEWAELDARECI